MLVRCVAAVIVLTFIGVVQHPRLNLPLLSLLEAQAGGLAWDASGKHIRFAFLFRSGPVTDVCVSQTATRMTQGF